MNENKFAIGQRVVFANQTAVIKAAKNEGQNEVLYFIETGDVGLPMWIPESQLVSGEPQGPPHVFFNRRTPHMIMVDNFYKDPLSIRQLALQQEYVSNLAVYKGKRTNERFLWPFLKEEFERLLGRPIMDWLQQPANGCFQITGYNDPLVWHSDCQSFAAAIYLTPDAPISAGTSFWRDKKYKSRRPPQHVLEYERFNSDEERNQAGEEIYSGYNIVHPDNWELVDKVGAVFNRLVIWDAQMIHSASSYEGMESDIAERARLVQLFFFTIK